MNTKQAVFGAVFLILIVPFVCPPIWNTFLNRVEPWVFWMPFNIFYINFALGIFCLAMIILYVVESRRREL